MKWINPSEIEGEIQAPPSKSMMIRAAAASLLNREKIRIMNPSFCDDALVALRIIQSLGANLEEQNHGLIVTGGFEAKRESRLDCQESGLCIRMFAPIAALQTEQVILTGSGSLVNRPMGMMEGPFSELGCYCMTNGGRLPIQVKGPLKGGKVRVDGSQSSQFLTGLLMSLPLCESESEVSVSNLQSRPYVAMTIQLLSEFGVHIEYEKDFRRFFIKGSQEYKKTIYAVEGDWSGASFFLVAGALGGQISVHNLSMQSCQADKKILNVLELVGAKTTINNDTVTVERGDLKAFEFDATQCPDLFPPLIVLASFCEGKSQIFGVQRLCSKESNRGEALLTEFRKIKARLKLEGNKMVVEGSSPEGGIIRSHGDHRIAMAAAVAGLRARKGVGIEDWPCVSKSYPDFFGELESIIRRP